MPAPFAELALLEALIDRLGTRARVETLVEVSADGETLPVYGIRLGSEDPAAPTLALIGGVHGLERIGALVALAHLEHVVVRLEWDALFRRALETTRLVYVPIANPVGMLRNTRSNGRGVDLMRNGPPHPDARASFLVGGHRLSPRLPWYAGPEPHAFEPEAAALCDAMRRWVMPARAGIAVDCHSGFGMVDRLWFPYARTRRPIPELAEMVGMARLIDQTLPNHVYRIEPTAGSYTIAGDLWDHLYDQHLEETPDQPFLPLTLEMGSWAWVRKNPRQLGSRLGIFNPIKRHRLERTLRRHLPLLDLLFHAVASADAWTPDRDAMREQWTTEGFTRWY